jgi:dephospho-CoA kinase
VRRVGLTGGVASGKSTVAAILAELGAVVIDADQLAREVVAARRRLEAIIHPLVHARSRELEEAAPEGALVVHDIPLLAESGRAETFDAVVVVDAPRDVQVERMTSQRGWTVEDAEARIAAQATREQRLAIATHVIENTGTLEDLRDRVTEVFEELVSTGSTDR